MRLFTKVLLTFTGVLAFNCAAIVVMDSVKEDWENSRPVVASSFGKQNDFQVSSGLKLTDYTENKRYEKAAEALVVSDIKVDTKIRTMKELNDFFKVDNKYDFLVGPSDESYSCQFKVANVRIDYSCVYTTANSEDGRTIVTMQLSSQTDDLVPRYLLNNIISFYTGSTDWVKWRTSCCAANHESECKYVIKQSGMNYLLSFSRKGKCTGDVPELCTYKIKQ